MKYAVQQIVKIVRFTTDLMFAQQCVGLIYMWKGNHMIILREDKKIASLLPPEDARQVLLALFSELDDLPEMTPLAYMAYTAIKCGSDSVTNVKSKAGKVGGAPKGNQNAVKQTKTSKTTAVQPKLTKQAETSAMQSEQTKQPSSVTDENVPCMVADASGHGDGESGAGLQELRFVEFWAAYPRKVGKEAARKVWRHIKPTADLQLKILSAIEQAKGSGQWQLDNGRFIPNPTTWLNQGRWDDEIQPYSVKPAKRTLINKGNFTQRTYCDEDLEQFITNDFGNG